MQRRVARRKNELRQLSVVLRAHRVTLTSIAIISMANLTYWLISW